MPAIRKTVLDSWIIAIKQKMRFKGRICPEKLKMADLRLLSGDDTPLKSITRAGRQIMVAFGLLLTLVS